MGQEHFPNNIKTLRKERTTYSQEEIAELCGWTGGQQGKLERGERRVKMDQAVKLADLIGCSLDELMARVPPLAAASAEERLLLVNYRAAVEKDRAVVRRILDIDAEPPAPARKVAVGGN